MPYKNPEDRKRTKAAKEYEQRPDVMARHRARNQARYELMKEGAVSVGDGNDVQHNRALSKGGGTGRSNLSVLPKGENRSFARNNDHSLKSETSKRERKVKRK